MDPRLIAKLNDGDIIMAKGKHQKKGLTGNVSTTISRPKRTVPTVRK